MDCNFVVRGGVCNLQKSAMKKDVMKKIYAMMVCMALALAACDDNGQGAPAGEETQSVQSVPPLVAAEEARGIPVHVSEWMGRWNGPEGTYLDISEREIGYKITISDLDGPRDFEGMTAADSITFERDGKEFVIRPGSGAETGMKWLADKKHCLVVQAGEGYCRD